MNGCWTACAAFAAGAYILGSVPFGLLIGKMRGVDIRKHGSGNIGATNVFRTVGKGWGLLAFALDFLKGLLPVLAAARLFPGCPHLPLAAGVSAVLGHMYSVFMKFKGGKGVATGFGMLVGLMPMLVLVAFAIFAVLVAAFRYISLGSIAAALFLAVAVWIPCGALGCKGADDLPLCVVITATCLFSVWRHRANIVRLASGTENRIFLGGSAQAGDGLW